jgi:hypothetical protein
VESAVHADAIPAELGSAADKTLGNTEALTKARAALKCMSAAVHVTGKSKD